MQVLFEETIAAQSTALGEGAIAVIRISGKDASGIARHILGLPEKALPMTTPRRMRLSRIVLRGRPIDNALTAFFPGPTSYTGEDVLEVYCHGGLLVAAKVLEAALEAGARLADPGEFPRRAFLNGRMDLTQAEAVMDVIRARAPLALEAAREQLEGGLGRAMGGLRERLLGLVANIEAWIDFPEEDIDPETGAGFLASVRGVIAEIDVLLATADDGRILREGIRLVLCGKPNAGKSSLLNCLLRSERAIVDAAPGTTRDTLEEAATLGGWPFRITDTAGLRETTDRVERIGVERARAAMRAADILLRVVDATEGAPPAPEAPNELIALNKTDLLSGPLVGQPDWVHPISCLTGAGFPELIEALVARARGAGAARPTALAINARHQACLNRAHASLEEAASELSAGTPPEFAATGLRSALDAIGEILGVADTEEILGEIFQRFCIGK